MILVRDSEARSLSGLSIPSCPRKGFNLLALHLGLHICGLVRLCVDLFISFFHTLGRRVRVLSFARKND